MSSEDEDIDCDTTDVKGNPNHGLPSLSLSKYNKVYQQFQKWNKSNGWCPVSQDLLLKYFAELALKSKPTSLFAIYSMLKATFRTNDDINIGGYSKLLNFLKQQNLGYTPTKAKVFTEEEIEKFVNEAPDETWLDVKVVCIFGVSGAYSTTKLTKVMVEHVKNYDDLILVTIPRSDTMAQSSFTITGTFFRIVQKYADLRPKNVTTNRFFLNYYQGKCTAQHIGVEKFRGMPRKMARYLKLPEPGRYAGLSFRNSVKLYGNANSGAWNMAPSAAVEQVHEQTELDYQTGQLKTSSFSNSHPAVDTFNVSNTNGNRIGTECEHACTLSCAHVKCASDENEESVLHAFDILKPSEYTITDVTPAVYPSEPACRWIVAYTHNTDAITAFSADRTFKKITRSIPSNVRICEEYIRGVASQVLPAYVVVYGVNCKCHNEAADIFDFTVNEVDV